MRRLEERNLLLKAQKSGLPTESDLGDQFWEFERKGCEKEQEQVKMRRQRSRSS